MRRVFVLAVLTGLTGAPAAFADEIEVKPGMWSYEVSAMLGALPMGQTGRECVTEGEAKRSLSETAEALGQGCAIKAADPIDGGYSFKMACDGGVVGEVDGEIVATDGAAVLNAEGWIGEGVERAPVTIIGAAERLSEVCVPG